MQYDNIIIGNVKEALHTFMARKGGVFSGSNATSSKPGYAGEFKLAEVAFRGIGTWADAYTLTKRSFDALNRGFAQWVDQQPWAALVKSRSMSAEDGLLVFGLTFEGRTNNHHLLTRNT